MPHQPPTPGSGKPPDDHPMPVAFCIRLVAREEQASALRVAVDGFCDRNPGTRASFGRTGTLVVAYVTIDGSHLDGAARGDEPSRHAVTTAATLFRQLLAFYPSFCRGAPGASGASESA